MRAVHFGAGNIGRGFIGPMLSDSGYKVCFVGRNKLKIDQLQQRGRYPVTLANEQKERFIVENVTALHLSDADQVARAVEEAEIVTTAVGTAALKDIAFAIAKGIENRLSRSLYPKPLHVIACENGTGSSQKLKALVYRHLKQPFKGRADRCVAFPDVMVDRIVPVQTHKDPLEIVVEPFSEWVIPRGELIADYTEIKGVHYVDSLESYLERKLFTVNAGHCSAAYFGYLEGYSTIQEALSDSRIKERVLGVLQETGALLVHLYGFDPAAHDKYIHKIIERFRNPNFNDKISRVARSPLRKLSQDERLIKPALLAHKFGLKTTCLVSAITSALLFADPKDPEAVLLQDEIRNSGLGAVLASHLGIPAEHPLHGEILRKYHAVCLEYPHRASCDFEAMI